MPEFLHNLRLCQEVFRIHSSWFECFYGHRGGVVPKTFPDFSKLTLAQFANKLQWRSVDFPLVPSTVTEALSYGFLNLRTKSHDRQSIAVDIAKINAKFQIDRVNMKSKATSFIIHEQLFPKWLLNIFGSKRLNHLKNIDSSRSFVSWSKRTNISCEIVMKWNEMKWLEYGNKTFYLLEMIASKWNKQ